MGIAKRLGICLAALIVAGAIWIFWLWQYFAPPPLNPPVENPQYSRSDCMVRAAIQYPKTAKDTGAKDIIGGQIYDTIWDAVYGNGFPIASMGIKSSDIDNLYAQFTQNCDRKFQMIGEMVDAYHREYPKGARLTVTRDRLVPGPDTIQVFGPFWNDGEPNRRSK